MAALQQELSLAAVERSDRARKQKHFRLIADPSIAVSRIESTLQGYMDHCKQGPVEPCVSACIRAVSGFLAMPAKP